MPRGRPTAAARADKRLHQFAAGFLTETWTCVHHGDRSEITVYSMAEGKRITIGEVRQTAGASAEVAAEFIVSVINKSRMRDHLINEMIAALEICLECETLDWAAEHDAELVLRHAKHGK